MFGVIRTLLNSRACIALACLLGYTNLMADTPLSRPESMFPELETILQHMENSAPEMLIQRAKVQAAEADQHSRLADKYPQVFLNVQLTNRSEFRNSNPSYQNTTQPFGIARVEQELYHWGALDAWRDIGEFRKAIADNDYVETYRLLTLRVRSLYMRLLFAREQVKYFQAEYDRLQKNLATSEQRAQSGRITADELQMDRLLVDEADIALSRASNDAQMLEEDLRLATAWEHPILGIDGSLINQLNALQVADAAEAEEVIATAAPPSTEYLNKQQELNIEEADYTRIRSKNLPIIDAVAEAYQDQIATQGLDNVDRTVLSLYIRINWNVFDGFETQWQKIQSKAKQRALEREAEHIAEQDKIEVKRLRHDRNLIERNITLWKGRVKLSENTVSRVMTEREKNTATDNDVDAARNDLLADQLTLASYHLDLFANSIELLSIYGRDPFGAPKQPFSAPVEDVYPENFYW